MRNKIKSAAKWQILNISLQAILQFAFIMVSARILPKEIHGAFAILNSIIFVLSITSEGGVSSAIIQRKEVNKKHISISFYITIFLSVLMFLVIVLFASTISTFYQGKITSMQLKVASLFFIFKALGSVSGAFLVKDFKFKELFIANNISFLFGNILTVYALAIYGFGIYALIFGFITTQFVQSILFYLFAKHSMKFSWGKEEYQQIAKFGSSFILLRIVNYLSTQMDKLLIGKYFDVAALSIFEKGQYIAKMPPKYLGNSIDSIMFSSFSKIEILKKKQAYFLLIVKIIMTIVFFFNVVLFFNADLIVRLVLGVDWLDTIPYLKIFACIMPAMILGRLGDIIVRSENKMFNSIPIKIGFLIGIATVIILFKAQSLILITVLITIVYWFHGIFMLGLSLFILNSKIKEYIVPILTPIGIALLFTGKYYLISLLGLSSWIELFLNIIIDIAIVGGALYYLKDKPFVKAVFDTISVKIKNIKS